MTFAEKMRELRDQAGLSEVQLAELSGVSFSAVHHYGLGIRAPTFSAVVKLARVLGVTCQAFADCEGFAAAEPSVQPDKPKPPSPVNQDERPDGEPT
jgi:transcriptional regulator with XRE-family HTH domain